MTGPENVMEEILTLVISLPESQDRREKFAVNAQQYNRQWSFFDAHRKINDSLIYSQNIAILQRGQPLTDTELACYSSHYAAWQHFLNSDAKMLIVFEDDAVPLWNFVNQLDYAALAGLNIDFLRLFPGFLGRVEPHGRIFGRRIFRGHGYQFSTVAYVLTRHAAEVLVGHCKIVTRPVDDEMDRSWAHGLEKYSVYPPVVMEDLAESTIGSERWKSPAKLGNFKSIQHKIISKADGIASRSDGSAKPLRRVASKIFGAAARVVLALPSNR